MIFYPLNFIFIGIILAPNLLLILAKPQNELINPSFNKGFEVCERIGQTFIFIFPLFFKVDSNIWNMHFVLVGLVVCIVVYYLGWIRFYIKGREYSLLFKPMLYLPLPLALAPICYFLLLSSLLNSWLLLFSSVVFAIGHIPISYQNYLATRKEV